MRCLPLSLARVGWHLAAACLLLAYIACGRPAQAAVPRESSPTAHTPPGLPGLPQLQRTLLTARDGVPSAIWAIAQDREGYLWLGGATGLFRFDGVHFEPIFKGRLPSGTITALFGDAGGNLWIGDHDGGVTRVHDGVIERVDRGLPAGTVLSFQQMADGTLWVVTLTGAASLVDGSWRQAGPAQGFDAQRMNVAGKGKDGSCWIFADAAYRLRPGATRFERYSRDAGVAAMADLPAAMVYPGSGVTADMIVDRYGALWVPTNGRLVRWHAEESRGGRRLVAEHVKPSGEDADMQVTADFSDRDGNVWIASSAGLEQFRATRFVPVTLPAPVYRPTIAAGADGSLWIASNSATPPMRVGSTVTMHPELGAHIACIVRGPDGSVWFSGDSGIHRYRHGLVTSIRAPGASVQGDRHDNAGLGCQSMRVDADGSLWISMTDTGVSRWDGLSWRLIDARMAESIQLAGERAWLGFSSGRMSSIEHGRTTVYSRRDGLDVGAVHGLYEGTTGLWVVGSDGVMVRVGKHFQRLTGSHGERFENVVDIAELANGDLWMVSPRGVYRVAAAEIRRAWSTPAHAVSYQLFDQSDGLQGAIGSQQGDPLEVGDDGRLWVATERGVAWIDPLHLAPAPVPPAVSIESINDRDARFARGLAQNLAKGTRSLTITYSAATLSVPSRTRFRYRLQGVDDDWQAAGERREAHYSNLAPGQYTFQVQASDADGAWTGQATTFPFRILPLFYQTWWFKGLCAAGSLAALWLLYLLRIAHVCAQLDARMRERESMARDFHDTILQSFHGLLLHVEVAAGSIPEGPARQKLDKAITISNDALTEGREKIGQLRSLAEPLEELPTDIARLANLFGGLHPMAFSLRVEGELQPLHPSAASDLHAIVRELVINAFRHSRADNLQVVLRYGRLELNIVVVDDGRGIDPAAIVARAPGHWGLQGMHERARQIGGRLTIGTTASGGGTRASLRIPARFIYARRHWFRRAGPRPWHRARGKAIFKGAGRSL